MSSIKIKKSIAFLGWVIRISRPRIWMYTAGPFFFGLLFWYQDFSFFLNIHFILLFLWLTLPANVFLYALNDAFDYETDLKNPKKQGFELRSSVGDKEPLISIATISGLTFLFFFFDLSLPLKTLSILWFMIVITYNGPPFRFKSIPVADLLFAFTYYLWGIFGYYLASGQPLSLLAILLMAFFGITMHIYSSSGDIEYDKNAGVRTISTVLGSVRDNILVCIALCMVILMISAATGLWYVSLTILLYIAFFLVHFLYGSRATLLGWYRHFIFLHYVAGGILTLTVIYGYA